MKQIYIQWFKQTRAEGKKWGSNPVLPKQHFLLPTIGERAFG